MTLESSKIELEDMEMDPYSLFTSSIKSPLTKEAYLRKDGFMTNMKRANFKITKSGINRLKNI